MAYEDLVLSDGPAAYWPLQEAAGPATAAPDASGHGHDLAFHFFSGYSDTGPAGPLFGAAGPASGVLALEGRAGAQHGALAALDPGGLPDTTGPFSWEAWVYWDSTRAGSLQFSDFLGWSSGAWGTPGLNTTLRYYSAFESSPAVRDTLNVGVGDFGGRTDCAQTLAGTPTTDAWHHVVLTSDGAACALWIDGALATLAASDPGPMQDNGPTARFWLLLFESLGLGVPGLISHAALYPVVLLPCQIVGHFDLMTTGTYTPCVQWLRLQHASGRADWRTNGERVEERAADHLGRDHDGTTSTTYSGGVPVLRTPLALLTAAPALLVGKDPATNLPAYCPPPPVVAITPAPAPPTPPAVPPDEFRCNIAHYVAGQMELAYNVAAAKIMTLNTAENALVGLGGPLAGVILSLLGVVFPPLFIITGFGVSLLALLAQYHDHDALLPLGGPAVEAMAHALYCALQPDSGGLYQITGTTLFNWSYNLTTFGSSFSGDQLAEVRLLITVYQIEYWHNLALQAGASGSTLCAGYSCSGLLP